MLIKKFNNENNKIIKIDSNEIYDSTEKDLLSNLINKELIKRGDTTMSIGSSSTGDVYIGAGMGLLLIRIIGSNIEYSAMYYYDMRNQWASNFTKICEINYNNICNISVSINKISSKMIITNNNSSTINLRYWRYRMI